MNCYKGADIVSVHNCHNWYRKTFKEMGFEVFFEGVAWCSRQANSRQ